MTFSWAGPKRQSPSRILRGNAENRAWVQAAGNQQPVPGHRHRTVAVVVMPSDTIVGAGIP